MGHRVAVLRDGVTLPLSDSARGALAGFGGDRVIVGFRPEAVTLGDGTLKGITRVVEDLGAEVFVHLAVDPRWRHGVDRGQGPGAVRRRAGRAGAGHRSDPPLRPRRPEAGDV